MGSKRQSNQNSASRAAAAAYVKSRKRLMVMARIKLREESRQRLIAAEQELRYASERR